MLSMIILLLCLKYWLFLVLPFIPINVQYVIAVKGMNSKC